MVVFPYNITFLLGLLRGLGPRVLLPLLERLMLLLPRAEGVTLCTLTSFNSHDCSASPALERGKQRLPWGPAPSGPALSQGVGFPEVSVRPLWLGEPFRATGREIVPATLTSVSGTPTPCLTCSKELELLHSDKNTYIMELLWGVKEIFSCKQSGEIFDM